MEKCFPPDPIDIKNVKIENVYEENAVLMQNSSNLNPNSQITSQDTYIKNEVTTTTIVDEPFSIKVEPETTDLPNIKDEFELSVDNNDSLLEVVLGSYPNNLDIIMNQQTTFYKCDLCNYRCAHKGVFNRHIITHRARTVFQCKACDARYLSKSSFQTHLFIHNGEKPFKCNLCDYESPSRHNLRRHALVIHLKPFGCNICDYKCAFKDKLKTHMLKHNGERPFECNLCHAKYLSKATLKHHMTEIHESNPPLTFRGMR